MRYTSESYYLPELCSKVSKGFIDNSRTGFFELQEAARVLKTIDLGLPLPTAYVFDGDLYGHPIRLLCHFLTEASDLFYDTIDQKYVDIALMVRGRHRNCVPVSYFLNTVKILGALEHIQRDTFKERARAAADRVFKTPVNLITFSDVTEAEFEEWLMGMSDVYQPDWGSWYSDKRGY